MLTGSFGASTGCWTSNLRTREGLTPFAGVESECADFTVSDAAICHSITKWLTSTGAAGAERWVGRNVTYHFEVKTTANRCAEPFSMSNAQMSLVSMPVFMTLKL